MTPFTPMPVVLAQLYHPRSDPHTVGLTRINILLRVGQHRGQLSGFLLLDDIAQLTLIFPVSLRRAFMYMQALRTWSPRSSWYSKHESTELTWLWGIAHDTSRLLPLMTADSLDGGRSTSVSHAQTHTYAHTV